jgi:hypothetical protein
VWFVPRTLAWFGAAQRSKGAPEKRFNCEPSGAVCQGAKPHQSTVDEDGGGEASAFQSLDLAIGALNAGWAMVMGIDSVSASFNGPNRESVRGPGGAGLGGERRVFDELT